MSYIADIVFANVLLSAFFRSFDYNIMTILIGFASQFLTAYKTK